MAEGVVEQPRNIGKVQKYVTGTDWESYIEQLDFFFIANGINDAKTKKAVLLTNIPTETYQLIRDLVAPVKLKEEEITYSIVVERLQKHLKPQKSALVARYDFDNRQRNPGESVSDYVAVLKHLATECKFSDAMRQERLRDRIVSGIRDKKMLSELLKVELIDLTFDNAVKKCLAIEQSCKDVKLLQGESNESVNILSNVKSRRYQRAIRDKIESESIKPKEALTCYRCGGKHDAQSCPYKKEKCHYCKKAGHLQKVCRKKIAAEQKPASVNTIDDVIGTMEDIVDLYHATPSQDDRKPVVIPMLIEGCNIPMELDTGSAVSIVSESVYLKYLRRVPLRKTTLKLRTYTGEIVKPSGMITVTVEYNEQKKELPLYVIKTQGPCLLGREWFQQIRLNWPLLNLDTSFNNLQQILNRHKSVFSEGLGRLKQIKAHLNVNDNVNPQFWKARHIALARKHAVEKALDDLEAKGVITKITHSEWAAPIVTPVKRDGTVRVCGDFKVTINPHLKIDEYPLPHIDEIYANLSGGKEFSVIDLRQAYLQMELDNESKQYLIINTHRGLYQYQRLPYGVASAPAIWQRSMDQVLQGISGVQCYLDDIIITGKTNSEHLSTLDKVLQRLEENGLKVNKEKCKFLQDSVEYLGHVISATGLHQAPSKVQAIVDMPTPRDVTQLRSFIGMVQYYSKFLPNLSTTLAPLNQLLHKGVAWRWTDQEEKCFQKVKNLLLKNNILVHYDPTLPLIMASDSSAYGLGAVLSHLMPNGSEKPIAYASRSLSQREKQYAQIEKEALSIVWGVRKFQTYLEGRKFTLVTDHKPLKYIMDPGKAIPVTAAARLQRWCLFLGAFSYDINFRGTLQHANCDGLSRLPLPDSSIETPDEAELYQTTVVEALPVKEKDLRLYTRRDPVLSRVLKLAESGWSTNENDPDLKPYLQRRDEISVHHGEILMWGTRVIVPQRLRERVLHTIHEGHIGMAKMKGLARGYLWWPNLDKDIESKAKKCQGCQEVARSPRAAPLHRWEYPAQPWQRLQIDFAGPVQGKMLLVCTDAHSKWPEIVIMKGTTAEETVGTLRSIFARMGLPEQIVSDNGSQFTSTTFQKFVDENGIRHVMGAPYHPSTNGLAERFVQSFKSALKADQSDRTMQHKLDRFLLAYRTAPHATTEVSPAQLLFGRNLKTRLDLLLPNLKRKVDGKLLQNENKHLTVLSEGQKVWIRNYRSGPKWVSGTVLQPQGPLMYEVQTSNHQTWKRHVEQLRTRETSDPSPSTEETEEASMNECPISTKDSEPPHVTTEESLSGDSPEPPQVPSAIAAPKTTRSGRTVKTPVKFKDFDLT